MKRLFRYIPFAAILSLACACEIENDIAFPIVEANITAFEVEGMCDENGEPGGKAAIDKNQLTVSLNVDDTVDPSKLVITTFMVSNDAAIIPCGQSCYYPSLFPTSSFSNSGEYDTLTDFSSPALFTLRTYQDYLWTIKVNQIIIREVEFEGQVGKSVIDAENRNVLVYVNDREDLRNIKVKKFSIGGQHGVVIPSPLESGTYDFSTLPTVFYVRNANSDAIYEWKVFVYKTQAKTPVTANVFPRTVNATVSGTRPDGEVLLLEYRKEGASSWDVCPAQHIQTSGESYKAELLSLEPDTKYEIRATAGDETCQEQKFSTTAALQLENGGLDDWYLEGDKLWNPWPANGESFWDTGNRGATTVGDSNSKPSDDTSTGSGKSAYLQSKFIVIKFAAGNIFTGSYVKTDGTNGVLDFGRPFTAFPTKMAFDYKYKSEAINRVGNSDYEYLKGTQDECQIYIALADWDTPLQIRTNPKNLSLFDKNDPHVIAYADMISSTDQSTWKTQTLELKYNYTDRAPKYILVVCSSSRYGDFFTGGEGSTLQVDNFRLIYE